MSTNLLFPFARPGNLSNVNFRANFSVRWRARIVKRFVRIADAPYQESCQRCARLENAPCKKRAKRSGRNALQKPCQRSRRYLRLARPANIVISDVDSEIRHLNENHYKRARLEFL